MSDFETPTAGSSKNLGADFIGHQKAMDTIEKDIICGSIPLNLSVIGLTGTHKTYLIDQIITKHETTLREKGILPLQVSFCMFLEKEDDPNSQFFREIVRDCILKMEEQNWLTEDIRTKGDKIPNVGNAGFAVKNFFYEVKRSRYHILLIIDGFDRARDFFDGTNPFQFLRILADQARYGLSLLLISRRDINKIEVRAGSANPYLFNLFVSSTMRLGMFSEDDLDIYFSNLSEKTMITSSDKEKILSYSGGHPRLLEKLGSKIIDQFQENREINVEKAADTLKLEFSKFYQDLIEFLRDGGLLSKLLQILFGPIVDVENHEITELEMYGLIKLSENKQFYVTYSEHFQDYLGSQEFTAELWPLWSETEIALREIITTVLSESPEYGANWTEKLKENFSNLRLIFKACQQLQEKEKKFSPSSASLDLISFTNPSELFQIIFVKNLWDSHFSNIFSNTKQYWEERNQFLTKCRNALAHNRENILDPAQVHKLEEYCREILAVHKQWSQSHLKNDLKRTK